ncbi:MAG: hypothetical protein EPN91_01685 [Salinibacterium sp.]|nr:MAG: hypothetical protein EPN91_01685 [Salinibacterium sp.]
MFAPSKLRLAALVVAILALGSVSSALAPAVASEGSVPFQVELYVSDPDGLLARLEDLTGPDAHGGGIHFDKTTKVGQVNRVFVFSDDYASGKLTRDAVVLDNLWTAAILIGGKPIGLATIWINPSSHEAELADFEKDAPLTKALNDVGDDVFVVRDAPRAAWLTLHGSSLALAEPGSSGLSGTTTLKKYQPIVVNQVGAQKPAASSNLGFFTAVGLIGVAVAVTVWLLFFSGAPRLRRD